MVPTTKDIKDLVTSSNDHILMIECGLEFSITEMVRFIQNI